ncbi:MAG: aldehyde dehydrogenase family protein [Nakamurella sp.]
MAARSTPKKAAPKKAATEKAAVQQVKVQRATPAAAPSTRVRSASASAQPTTGSSTAVPVLKTYKLFIGGAFPRSESGRTYPVHGPHGDFLANAAQSSRKDARDAVVAARKAFPGWSHATAYNRCQVIYRIAEMLQGRRAEFIDLLVTGEGTKPKAASQTVDTAIDRLVHYAGWTDKIAAVFGSSNPVAGPFFSFSTPEPTGVVAAFAPQDDSLLGLISVIAPIITSGNTVVVITSATHPLPAVTLAEVLATSDVPGGVVNILTGEAAEMGTHLATHADVNALDLTGVEGDLRTDLARDAAGTVKRVYIPKGASDFSKTPGTARLRAFLETKTVWHPTGAVSLAGGTSY